MTITEVKEAFAQCEYPFYKQLTVEHDRVCFTLYSLYSSYQKPLVLQLSDQATLIHQIALEVIKLRFQEMQDHQLDLVKRAG